LKEKSGTEIKELRNGRKYTFRFLKTGNFSWSGLIRDDYDGGNDDYCDYDDGKCKAVEECK
jgi:hypothetical protein